MRSALFWFFVISSHLLPIWFVLTIWKDRWNYEANRISKDSRTMYVDVAKGLAASCGIAVSIVVSVGAAADRGKPPVVSTFRQVAVVYLIVGVIAATVTGVAFCRCYERARTRFLAEYPPDQHVGMDTDQGTLNGFELFCLLIPSGIALIGFLVGFLFLARIAFYI